MKNKRLFLLLSLFITVFLPGCSVIAGIFKAGFWTAIILVLLIAGLGIYAYRKITGPN